MSREAIERHKQVLRTGVCPDCLKGALHVCPLLVRDIVQAAVEVRDEGLG